MGHFAEDPAPFSWAGDFECGGRPNSGGGRVTWFKAGARAVLPVEAPSRRCAFARPGIFDVTGIKGTGTRCGDFRSGVASGSLPKFVEEALEEGRSARASDWRRVSLSAVLLRRITWKFRETVRGLGRCGSIINWNHHLTPPASSAANPSAGSATAATTGRAAYFGGRLLQAYPVASLDAPRLSANRQRCCRVFRGVR